MELFFSEISEQIALRAMMLTKPGCDGQQAGAVLKEETAIFYEVDKVKIDHRHEISEEVNHVSIGGK